MDQNCYTNLPKGMNFLSNYANNWENFKQRYVLDLQANEIPDKLKVSLLLNQMGREAIEIFHSFVFTQTESKDNFNHVISKFEDHCKPRKNVMLNRFNFFSKIQEVGESVDEYVTKLRELSSECNFENQTDSLIRDMLVLSISDKEVQDRLLTEPDLQLTETLNFCRANEVTQPQIDECRRIFPETVGVVMVQKKRTERQDEAVTSAIAPFGNIKKKNENNIQEAPFHPDIKTELEDLHHSVDIQDDTLINNGVVLLEEVENSPKEMVDMNIKLEDLHHSIDIKEESPINESQPNQDFGTQICEPFECPACNLVLTTECGLKDHVKIHTGEKLFKRELGDLKSRPTGRLKFHFRTQTGEKSFECIICGCKYSDSQDLKVHLENHTGVVDALFECKICNYKFSRKDRLTRHLRIHSGEKPFECKICDYKCREKGYLKRHLQTHSGEKPFACNICDYKCSRKAGLQRHLQTHNFKRSSNGRS